MRSRRIVLTCAGLLASPIPFVKVFAQIPADASHTAAPSPSPGSTQSIGDIVVTARRQQESLQKVPIAITAFNQRALTENQVNSAFDLQRVVPGLTVNADSGNASLPSFSIRGRGQNYGAAAGSVETYFADVPLSAPFQMPTLPAQFFDLASFQVLKGPQGTLFGRSTTGGAVLVVPQAPTDDFGGYVRLQGGSHNDFQLEAAVNLPLGEKAAFRVAAFHWNRDGYMHSLGHSPSGAQLYDSKTGAPLSNQTYDNQNETEVRGTLLLKPTESFTNSTIFTYHMDQTRASTGSGLALGPPNFFGDSAPTVASPGYKTRTTYADVNFRRPPNDVWALINTSTYDVSDELTLKNIFGYVHAVGYTNDGEDADGTSNAVVDVFVPPSPRRNSQLTDEAQLQGHSFGDRLSWTIGGLYDRTREPGVGRNGNIANLNIASLTQLGGPDPVTHRAALSTRYFSENITSYGAYGAATLKITDRIDLSAGYRHSWDHVTAIQDQASQTSVVAPIIFGPVQNFGARFQSDVYNVDADFHPARDVMIYGGYRRGYKRGGFNSSALPPAPSDFAPETVDDFHVGAKTSFTVGGVRGRFNIEGFYDLYKGYQVSYLSGVVVDGGFQIITVTTNVPKTTFRGFEADLTLDPAPWLQVYGAYSFTDAYFTKFPDTTAPGDNPSLANNFVTYNSRNKASGYVRFHTELPDSKGEIALRPQVSYQSRFFTTPFNVSSAAAQVAALGPFNQLAHGGAIVPKYATVDLRVEWNHLLGSKFDVAFNVTNLTNKLYFIGTSSTLNFGVQGNSYGPPRMFSVDLSTKF